MTDETDRIKAHYSDREQLGTELKLGRFKRYNEYKRRERDQHIAKILHRHFPNLNALRILEIGAGKGGNLNLFTDLGIAPQNIFVNDLLPENRDPLKKYLPVENIHIGNAADLNFNDNFDLVFQSLVFTSVLSMELKMKLAGKMKSVCKNEGMILWYDFAYDNPFNKDVKGISGKEIRSLFGSDCKIELKKLTLAPPLGRRVGNFYNLFNSLPFLRTHLLAVIKKDGNE